MNQAFRLLTSAFLAVVAASALALAPAAAAEGGDEHGAKKKSTASETFIELQGVTATVVNDFRPAGVFQVEFGLEVPDRDLYGVVQHLEPRVRTACAEVLRAYAGDMYVYGSVPDADLIAAMMQDAIDEAVGQTGAQLVLGMVVVHPAH